jgi:hypothetical protein
MEHGRITQRGTFDDLLAVDGPFRRLAKELKGAEAAGAPGALGQGIAANRS